MSGENKFMTKYILHGGESGENCENNRNFFREIIEGFAEPVNILIVQFAREEEKWPERFEREKGKFDFLDQKIDFTIADSAPEVFRTQTEKADAIYFIGGSNRLLREKIRNIKNLGRLFQDKTVAGSSAGAIMLSKYSYNTDDMHIEEGLGILPIKVFVHYSDAKFKDALEELKNYKEDLEIKIIPETEFIVINK